MQEMIDYLVAKVMGAISPPFPFLPQWDGGGCGVV